jgi:iron complex transport system permease protein
MASDRSPIMVSTRARRRMGVWYAGFTAVLVAALVLGVSIGAAGPDAWRVPLALLDRLPWISIDAGLSDVEWSIVWNIRMPRVLLGGLVGGILSIAGASYQGVFRNPLVDPYLLGAAAGAGLGATFVFTVGREATSSWPVDPVLVVSFLAALVTVSVTYLVGGTFGGSSGTTLVLAGVAVSAFATALQTFLLQRNVDVVREVYSWILGRLSSATWSDVRLILPSAILSCTVLIAFRRHLDVFRVGDDEAGALGLSVGTTRIVVVAAATLGTAAAVAVSGLIGFVGLIVPHVVRLLVGASYRHVVPLSLIGGASFLILADIPGRTLEGGAETPIGVVTAFLGAPFFIFLLRSGRGPR